MATDEQLELREGLLFLESLTAAVIDASRVAPGQSVAGGGPNTSGGTLVRPGGRACYPAFWIRDFVMTLECGLIPRAEVRHALLLTARCQAPADWQTPSGSFVPRGSIADHITFDGKPIYFPGGFDSEAQGQPFGYYPCFDDPFYFVEMAWRLAGLEGSGAVLKEDINGMRLIDRLDLAFLVPTIKDDSELAWCDEAKRGVSFGFTDSIVHTGHLLFCSILRRRAAVQLVRLHELCGELPAAKRYRAVANTISENIGTVFAHPGGLLRASTGRSAQPDVWGSAFAVYSGVLPGPEAAKVAQALRRCLAAGTIAWKGNIRHVPTDGDFSEASAWEMPVNGSFRKDRYQNGAYWGTPTGWVCHAVARADPKAARELALDYIAELKAGDFRQGAAYGSPYECIHPDGDYRQNPVYLASVTCPLAAMRRIRISL